MKDNAGEPLNTFKPFVLSIAGAVGMAWAALAGPLTVLLQTQSPPPSGGSVAFEVASVKPNKSGDQRVRIDTPPGGRFVATNVPLRNLIRFAYGVQDVQLVGGPDWIRSERFDVAAKAEGNLPPFTPSGPPEPLLTMVRTLLA